MPRKRPAPRPARPPSGLAASELAALASLEAYAAATAGAATPLAATPQVSQATWSELLRKGLVERRSLSTGEVYGHRLTAAGAAEIV